MIAHLEDGRRLPVRIGNTLLGYRVLRWEFDFNDFHELMRNPELLGILYTRMAPPSQGEAK